MRSTLKLSLKTLSVILATGLFCFVLIIFIGFDDKDIVVLKGSTELQYSQFTVVLYHIISIVTTVLLSLLLYTYSWQHGSTDKNMQGVNNCKPNKLRGLVSGLLAVFPLIILYTISLESVNLEAILRILVFSPIFFWYSTLFKMGQFWIGYVLFAFIVVVTTFGYYLGYINYSINRLIVYKNGHIQQDIINKTSSDDYLNERNRNNLK